MLLTEISCCEHANWIRLIKSAACRILTPLKHKNTIICVQIFRKHAKLTLFYLKNNATVGYSPLKMCVLGQNVWVCFGLCNPPTASLPNCISAPRVASWRKTQRISFIVMFTQPACASSLRRRGRVKKLSPIFWIWTAIPSSIIIHSTYSTFIKLWAQSHWQQNQQRPISLCHVVNYSSERHLELHTTAF